MWIVRANISRFSAQKADSMGQDMSIVGAIGGGIAGAAVAGNKGTLPAAIAGAIVGNVGARILGSFIRIEVATGVVDVLIQEMTASTVKTTTTANIHQGSSTMESSQQTTESDRIPYRTQFQVSARQTNMYLDKAVAEITDKPADQIAGLS